MVFHRYKVELEEGFDNILVVDGVPVIDKSKLEKLLAKICKEFGKKKCMVPLIARDQSCCKRSLAEWFLKRLMAASCHQ